MKKIYGNDALIGTLNAMVRSGRTAQSLIFYGESGSGRFTAASYYTAQLVCQSPVDSAPCGECPACRAVRYASHPDVTLVPTSGKLGGYSVETARAVCADAFVKPNNRSGRKVYIFRNCRNMDVRTQNTLLKLIEEPPEYATFLFTAESKYEFLPTIISRCICFGLSLCTEEESRMALREEGYGEEEIDRAVSCFHGNVGMCSRYIMDEKLRKLVDLTKALTDSIIRKDEYGLNCAFYSVGSERENVRNVLSMTDKLFRDAAVLAKDSDAKTISCFPDGAARLSQTITAYQSARIHYKLEKAWDAVQHNVSVPLVLAGLCAEMMEIVS
ncbi:MAG: DNA polymerase III subunit delta' [Ruminococcus sp.]|nr:DNA polymerase III subunit delta' [Ruminococcus sp.]HBB20469.1 DNA polymerase III subunit delta' [Ruminococcus sp.]HOO07269.1 DNA polymerase III subunit delta' [Ruminococcus sp.]HOR21818.1 DNA polymerase III subunit delta' [Ruminococcus sp.]